MVKKSITFLGIALLTLGLSAMKQKPKLVIKCTTAQRLEFHGMSPWSPRSPWSPMSSGSPMSPWTPMSPIPYEIKYTEASLKLGNIIDTFKPEYRVSVNKDMLTVTKIEDEYLQKKKVCFHEVIWSGEKIYLGRIECNNGDKYNFQPDLDTKKILNRLRDEFLETFIKFDFTLLTQEALDKKCDYFNRLEIPKILNDLKIQRIRKLISFEQNTSPH